MRLMIPHIGTVLVLTEPWTFRLFHEHRNTTLAAQVGLIAHKGTYTSTWKTGSVPSGGGYPGFAGRDHDFDTVTLPVGTELKVDRLYIRKLGMQTRYKHIEPGNYERELIDATKEYSSVTFYATLPLEPGEKKPRKGRFWAKLDEVNTIECEVRDG